MEIKNQQKGLKRNIIDKYYTKDDIVIQCITMLKNNINILNSDLIIEPSAGNGAFISHIKNISDNYKFYDIEPEHDEIIKQDFLELDLNLNLIDKNFQKNTNIHIIGNPPFGRQSSIAIKFIKKCCLFANSISFILPKSFKKDSMKKYFNIYYHLIYEFDLPEKSFLVNKEEYTVPCIFQIYQRKEYPRTIIENIIPINFKFVKKEENPDISFRRVGVNAGTISTEIENKNIQSHYFIKLTRIKSDDNEIIETDTDKINNIIKKLNSINFEINNTVGPKSISKQELIKKFNDIL